MRRTSTPFSLRKAVISAATAFTPVSSPLGLSISTSFARRRSMDERLAESQSSISVSAERPSRILAIRPGTAPPTEGRDRQGSMIVAEEARRLHCLWRESLLELVGLPFRDAGCD